MNRRLTVAAVSLVFGLGLALSDCRQIAGLSDLELVDVVGGAAGSGGTTTTALGELGDACTGGDGCQSQHCSDGVCCDTACDGACEACVGAKSGGGLDGTCGPVPAGTDPDDECTAAACGGSGRCAPSLEWSRSFGGPDCESGAVASEVAGNVLLAVQHESEIDFGTGPISPDGTGANLALARFASSGTVLGAAGFQLAGDQFVSAVATDAAGNLLVCGVFVGDLTLGNTTLSSVAGSSDLFVAKFDENLVPQWLRSIASSGTDRCNDLAVDPVTHEVTVVGSVGGVADAGGGALPFAGVGDAVVARYGPTGTPLWSHTYGGPGSDRARGVAAASGRLVVTGAVGSAVDFGGGLEPYVAGSDLFALLLDGAGAYVASATFGGPGDDEGYRSVFDGTDVVVCGHTQGGVDFGLGQLETSGFDLFVTSLDQALAASWAKAFGGADTTWGERCGGLALHAGAITLTGLFETSIDFGGGPLDAHSVQDVFLASLATDGTHLWSARFGEAPGAGALFRAARAVVDPTGHVLLAAWYADSIDLGLGPHTAVGGGTLCTDHADVVVGRFLPPPP